MVNVFSSAIFMFSRTTTLCAMQSFSFPLCMFSWVTSCCVFLINKVLIIRKTQKITDLLYWTFIHYTCFSSPDHPSSGR